MKSKCQEIIKQSYLYIIWGEKVSTQCVMLVYTQFSLYDTSLASVASEVDTIRENFWIEHPPLRRAAILEVNSEPIYSWPP